MCHRMVRTVGKYVRTPMYFCCPCIHRSDMYGTVRVPRKYTYTYSSTRLSLSALSPTSKVTRLAWAFISYQSNSRQKNQAAIRITTTVHKSDLLENVVYLLIVRLMYIWYITWIILRLTARLCRTITRRAKIWEGELSVQCRSKYYECSFLIQIS